jgi:hypothetical protein
MSNMSYLINLATKKLKTYFFKNAKIKPTKNLQTSSLNQFFRRPQVGLSKNRNKKRFMTPPYLQRNKDPIANLIIPKI